MLELRKITTFVEALTMSPSAMSTLEVLQTCSAQRKLLLLATRAIDPQDSNLIIFDFEIHIPRLPHQLAIHIPFFVKTRRVFRTVVDERASMCIMSMA